MRKIATIAAVFALATAQIGTAAAAQGPDSATMKAAQTDSGPNHNRFQGRPFDDPRFIATSLAALAFFTWGLIAAFRHHHHRGGTPASP